MLSVSMLDLAVCSRVLSLANGFLAHTHRPDRRQRLSPHKSPKAGVEENGVMSLVVKVANAGPLILSAASL